MTACDRGSCSALIWEVTVLLGEECSFPLYDTPWCSSCHGALFLLHEWDCLHDLYFHLKVKRPLRGPAWSTQLKECMPDIDLCWLMQTLCTGSPRLFSDRHWLGVGGHQVCPLLSLNFGYFSRHFKRIFSFFLLHVHSFLCQVTWQ